jgi:hypothetical protein
MWLTLILAYFNRKTLWIRLIKTIENILLFSFVFFQYVRLFVQFVKYAKLNITNIKTKDAQKYDANIVINTPSISKSKNINSNNNSL